MKIIKLWVAGLFLLLSNFIFSQNTTPIVLNGGGGGGESTTVTDQPNGTDITLNGADIEINLDATELALIPTVDVANDRIFIYDATDGIHKYVTPGSLGGTDTNLGGNDQTLTGFRTITLGTNNLSITGTNGTNNFSHIMGATTSQGSVTDGTGTSQFQLNAAAYQLEHNDGTGTSNLRMQGDNLSVNNSDLIINNTANSVQFGGYTGGNTAANLGKVESGNVLAPATDGTVVEIPITSINPNTTSFYSTGTVNVADPTVNAFRTGHTSFGADSPVPNAGKVATFVGDVDILGVLDPTALYFSGDGSIGSYDPTLRGTYTIQYQQGRNLTIETDGVSDVMTFLNTGRIGINNPNPSVQLDVNGTQSLNDGNGSVYIEGGNITSTGTNNVAVGTDALIANTSGASNVAIGSRALTSNTTGLFNVSMGPNSLSAITTERFNTAVGPNSGQVYTNFNGVFYGFNSGVQMTTGLAPTLLGVSSAGSTTTGDFITSIGANSLLKNVTGNNHVAIGNESLFYTSGEGNTGLGYQSGYYGLNGDNNTYLGNQAGNTYPQDVANTFNATGVAGNVITVPVDFTSAPYNYAIGERIPLLITANNPAPLPLNSVSEFEVTSANTITSVTALTGTDIPTIVPPVIFSNSTALGHGATPTKSDQVVLGDDNVSEAKIGQLIFKTDMALVDGQGLVVNNGVFEPGTATGGGEAFYQVGTTTAPTAISQDVYTQGKVALGRTTVNSAALPNAVAHIGGDLAVDGGLDLLTGKIDLDEFPALTYRPDVEFFRNSDGSFSISPSFDLQTHANVNPVKVVYADKNATGANNGTSWTDAYITVGAAQADCNASGGGCQIRVAKARYFNNESPAGAWNQNTEIIGDLTQGVGVEVIFSNDVLNQATSAWALVSNHYEIDITQNVSQVFDNLNQVNGDFTHLTFRGSVALVDANAGSWYWDGAKLYVRTSDDRMPDADIYTGSNNVGLFHDGNTTLYIKDITVHGAASLFRNNTGHTTGKVYTENFSVEGAGTVVHGHSEAIFINPKMSSVNDVDILNLDIGLGGEPNNFLIVNPNIYNNIAVTSTASTATTAQLMTSHQVGSQLISVNGAYGIATPNVAASALADVNGAVALYLNPTIQGAGVSGTSAVLTGTGATATSYFINGSSSNNDGDATSDLESNGANVFLNGFVAANQVTTNSGTITDPFAYTTGGGLAVEDLTSATDGFLVADGGNVSSDNFVRRVANGLGNNSLALGDASFTPDGNSILHAQSAANAAMRFEVLNSGNLAGVELIGPVQDWTIGMQPNHNSGALLFKSSNLGGLISNPAMTLMPTRQLGIALGTGVAPTETLHVGGNILVEGYQTLTPVAAAGVPNNSLFIDSADNILKFKDNTGTVNNLY